MGSRTATAVKIINNTLQEFEDQLKFVEQDSQDAYALTIFINACCDTESFQSNRYSGLVHFPHARAAARIIEQLIYINPEYFKDAIKCASEIIIQRRIVHVDLCFG